MLVVLGPAVDTTCRSSIGPVESRRSA